jgi:putative membrane protein
MPSPRRPILPNLTANPFGQTPVGAAVPEWETFCVPEPTADPRFALANERTFLAWVRTALGLVVAAAALQAVDLPWPTLAVRGLSALLALATAAAAYLGWNRWRTVDVAIAEGRAAPPARAHIILAVVVGLVALAVVALTLT